MGIEPTCGDSATPLAPSGWWGEGVTVWSVSPMWGLHKGGQEVVHQGVAQQVALRIERHLLAHGHGKTFGQATMDLAVNDHRVDAGAAVVQCIETADLGLARGAVNVHHAQVNTEGEREVWWVVVMHGLETWLQAIWWLVVGLPSHFGHGLELAVVALDFEAIDFPVEVVFVDFEHVRCNLARLCMNFAGGQSNRGTGHRRRA